MTQDCYNIYELDLAIWVSSPTINALQIIELLKPELYWELLCPMALSLRGEGTDTVHCYYHDDFCKWYRRPARTPQ